MDNGASSYRRFLDGDENGFVEIVRDYKDGLILYLDSFVRNITVAAATTNYKEEVLFTVNYNPEITNTRVIRYNGVLYDITRVDTFEGYREDITLYCCRRARQ